MNDHKTVTLAKWKNCSPEDLLSLVHLYTSLPTHLDSPPWRMPPGHKDAAMINKLLGMAIMTIAICFPLCRLNYNKATKS